MISFDINSAVDKPKKPKVEKWRCILWNGQFFKTGKVYKVINDVITAEEGWGTFEFSTNVKQISSSTWKRVVTRKKKRPARKGSVRK